MLVFKTQLQLKNEFIMADNEFNIKSSTIEKGLDLVKDFVDKLISPTVSEIGLLLADNVKYLCGKNQVNILLKAKAYVEKNKIDIKQVPLKILVPFLENASLEEDETLQDKWAIMLANMASSETNLHNQIFPYILSQMSIEEFNGLHTGATLGGIIGVIMGFKSCSNGAEWNSFLSYGFYGVILGCIIGGIIGYFTKINLRQWV